MANSKHHHGPRRHRGYSRPGMGWVSPYLPGDINPNLGPQFGQGGYSSGMAANGSSDSGSASGDAGGDSGSQG